MGKKPNRKKVAADIQEYFDAAQSLFEKDPKYAHNCVNKASCIKKHANHV